MEAILGREWPGHEEQAPGRQRLHRARMLSSLGELVLGRSDGCPREPEDWLAWIFVSLWG